MLNSYNIFSMINFPTRIQNLKIPFQKLYSVILQLKKLKRLLILYNPIILMDVMKFQ